MIDRLVRTYLKIRNARSELRAHYEAQDADLKQQLEVVEAALMQHMRVAGIQSVNTDAGTAYVSTDSRATIADWSAFSKWVLENKAVDFLEQRVKKAAVEEYLQDTTELPPGVSLQRHQVVRVRKGGSHVKASSF